MHNNQENMNSIQNEAAENNQPKNEVFESKDISMDDGGKLASLVDEQQLEARQSHHINANTLQMAIINKMLPKGYKFEILEVVQRMMEANRKRNTGLANYQIKKPEIQNEKKQQRILQRYQQKKLREQQKLEQTHSMVMNDKDRFMKHESPSITTQNQVNSSKTQNPQKTSNEQQNIVHPNKQDSKTKSKSKKEQNEAANREIKNGDSNQNSKIDHQKPDGGSKSKSVVQGQDIDNQESLKGGSQYDCFPDKNRLKAQAPNDKSANIQARIQERDFKQSQVGEYSRSNEQNQDHNQIKPSDDQIMNDEDNKKSAKSRKRPPPKNRHNLEEHEPQAKISKNKDYIRDGNNQNPYDSGLYKSNQQSNQMKVDAGRKDQKMVKGGNSTLNSNYQTKVFTNVDLSKIKVYDKYQLLLESLISHPELEAYVQTKKNQPLFLQIPEKGFDKYEELQRENDGEGFMNFQMILYRMRNKKYGAGKNIVKENLIQTNIRSIFRICEKYFYHDDASVRISKVLEMHFENELAVSFNTKGSNQRGKKGETAKDDALNKKSKELHDLRRSSSQDDYYDNRSGEGHQGRSTSSKSRKKKDKKDKKKDKKDKKKKNKDKDNRKDHDQQKQTTKPQPDNINSEEEEEEDDDDSQFEMKQQLFEIITKKLTTEQKKGIIPIVFQNNGNKKQKFEFDLFSLEPVIFKKLEEYVQNCLSTNDSGFKNSSVAPHQKQEINGYQQQIQGDGSLKTHNNDQSKSQVKNDLSDDVQNQINQKLRENKMSLDTEIHDGQNFQHFVTNPQLNGNECGPAVDSIQPQAAFAQNNTRNQNLENRYDLIDKINQLENRQLRGIVPIVKSQNDGEEDPNQDDENQKLEFDLYELSDEKCIQLRNYIEMCLQQNEENKQKEENQKYMDQQIQMMIQDSQRNTKSLNDRTNQAPFDQNPQSYTADFQPQNMVMDPQNQVNQSVQNNQAGEVNNYDSQTHLQNNCINNQPQNISMNQSMKENNRPDYQCQKDQDQDHQQLNGQNLNSNAANCVQQNQNNDSQEQNEQQKSFLISKLELIKNTNSQATSLINFLSQQNEFIQLCNEGKELQENQIKFDNQTGNIIMSSLSLSQLIFLISVFQSEQLQQNYIDLMNGDQNKNIQPQNLPMDDPIQLIQNYNPDQFVHNEQQQLILLQQIEEEHQQNKEQINNHLQDQYAQLQQNQQLTQQLTASIQDPSNSQFQGVSVDDLQTTLQQTIKNEEILDQNIKNINTYMEQQTANYTLKIDEINKQLQQLRKMHADYLQGHQNNQIKFENHQNQPEDQVQISKQDQAVVNVNQYNNNLNEQSASNYNIINYNNQQPKIINNSVNDQPQMSQPQGSPGQLDQQKFDPNQVAKQESSVAINQPTGLPANKNHKELPSESKGSEKVPQKRGRKPKAKTDQQTAKNIEKNQLNDQAASMSKKKADQSKEPAQDTVPQQKNNNIDEQNNQLQIQQQFQENLAQEQLESQPILPQVFESNQNQQPHEQISSLGYVQDQANQVGPIQNEFKNYDGKLPSFNQGINTDQSQNQNLQNVQELNVQQQNNTGQQTMQLQQQYVMQEPDQQVQMLPQSTIVPIADQQSVPQNPQLIEQNHYSNQVPLQQHQNVIQDNQDGLQQQQQENNGTVYQMAQVPMQQNQMAQININDQVTNITNQDQQYIPNNQLTQNNQIYQQHNVNSNQIQYNQVIMQSNQIENPDTTKNEQQIHNQFQQEQPASEINNQQQQNFQTQSQHDMNNQFQYDGNDLKNQMIMAINLMNQNSEQIEQRMQMINQLTQMQQNIQAGLQQLGQMQDQNEQVQQQQQDLVNQFNQAQEQINQGQQEIQQYKLQQDQFESQFQQLQQIQMQINNQNNVINAQEDQPNNQQLQQQPSQPQNQNFQN